MEMVLGIVIGIAIAALCAYFFIKKFYQKKEEVVNPCANCTYHECNMTHGVCDRLAKDKTNLK